MLGVPAHHLKGYEWAFEVSESDQNSYYHYHVLLRYVVCVRGGSAFWRSILPPNGNWQRQNDLLESRLYIRKQQQQRLSRIGLLSPSETYLLRFVAAYERRHTADDRPSCLLPPLREIFRSGGVWPPLPLSDATEPASATKKPKIRSREDLLKEVLNTCKTLEQCQNLIKEHNVVLAADKHTTWRSFLVENMEKRGLEKIAAVRAEEEATIPGGRESVQFVKKHFNTPQSQRLLEAWAHAVKRNRVLWVTSPTRYGKSSWVQAHIPRAHPIAHIIDLERFERVRHTVIWCDDFAWEGESIEDCKQLLNNVPHARYSKVRYKHVTLEFGSLFGIIVTANRAPATYFPTQSQEDVKAILSRIDYVELETPLFDLSEPVLADPGSLADNDSSRSVHLESFH